MKKTIIIVDDEKNTRELLKEVLSGENYKVLEAENGKVCLEKLKTEKVDLIILDIMMPEMSGWDVSAEINMHNQLKKVPIIFLTAKIDSTSKQLGKFGAKEYIEKPFEIEFLLKRVKNIFSKQK